MLDEWYLLKMPNSESLQLFKICYFSAHRTVSYLTFKSSKYLRNSTIFALLPFKLQKKMQSNSFIFICGNL